MAALVEAVATVEEAPAMAAEAEEAIRTGM